MLQNWKEVIKMMLGAHPEIDDEARERKQKIMNKVFGGAQDIDGAIMHLDARKERMEKSILLNLRKNTNGFYNAFQAIPRNTRFIYIHAYQSFVWNRVVSERLKRFGTKVLVGDLAIKKEC